MNFNLKEKTIIAAFSVVFVLILIFIYFNQTGQNKSSTILMKPSPQISVPTTIPTSASPNKELPVYQEEPIPTTTYLKLNVSFELPPGWIVSKEKEVVYENSENDVYTLTFGDYKLIVGRGSTGRAYCNIKAERRNYVPLFNTLLGSQVFRDNPNDYSSTQLNVCSDRIRYEEIEYGTKIGQISYVLPDNWNENKLKDMDNIVESIRKK